ncbi:MAG: M48 family metalloprotease [Caldimicrobium sp.]
MIYEDLFALWLAFLLWEFLPANTLWEISFLYKTFLFVLKEILFIMMPFVLKQRYFERIYLFFLYLLFSLDITFFGFKEFFGPYYFSIFLILLWFLHYYLWYRFLFYGFSVKYFRMLLGLFLPFFILLFLEELLNYLGISFTGQFLFLLFGVLVFSPYFITKIWPIEKLSDSFLRETLLKFLSKERIKIREIYLLPSFRQKLYTAGLIGFIPPFRYLFFSKGLLEILNLEELLGVLAHEIGHLKKKHGFYLFILILTFPLFLFNSLYLLLIPFNLIFSDLEEFMRFLEGPYGIYIEILIALWLFLFAFLFLRFILAYFLRSFEREADLYGLELLQTPKPLISALYKIGEISGQLFKSSWHHYGLWERILYLKNAAENPEIIKRHSLHIRKKLIFWLILNVSLVIILNFFDFKLLNKLLKIFFH